MQDFMKIVVYVTSNYLYQKLSKFIVLLMLLNQFPFYPIKKNIHLHCGIHGGIRDKGQTNLSKLPASSPAEVTDRFSNSDESSVRKF